MRPLHAVTLPTVRGQLAASLRRFAIDLQQRHVSAAEESGRQKLADLWRTQANTMARASLWWVSPDMTTLAADTALSGDDFPEWLPDVESRAGLLVWDGGLPIRIINRSRIVADEMVTIDAVSWAPIPDWSQHPEMRGMRIELWSRRGLTGDRRTEALKLITIDIDPDRQQSQRIMIGNERVGPEQAIWRILCATMLLSHQPTVGTTRAASFQQDGGPRESRTREIPDVKVIELRTVRDWKVGPDGLAAGDGRDYTHRWIVRGHQRTYHVGPGGQRAEKRWIAPYVAGPEGAPLIPKQHVWVWRR